MNYAVLPLAALPGFFEFLSKIYFEKIIADPTFRDQLLPIAFIYVEPA